MIARLTYNEKVMHREAIERLKLLTNDMETAMSRGELYLKGINTFYVRQLTQSEDPDTQLKMLKALLEHATVSYMNLLKQDALFNYSSFCEYLVPEEPPAPHHEFLCDHLEAIERRELMRLIVSMPPGHAKSTYSSHRFPAWYMGKHPTHKYIQAGHSQDFVENEFGKRVRGIIDSDKFRDIFPDIKLASDTKAAGLWAIARHGGKYLTRGVGQGISGFRANVAAVDDPYATEEDAKSETIRKKVQAWFNADLSTRLLPKSPLFIVATRWHPDDLCGVAEQNTKNNKGQPWTIINLPAIAEDNPNSPDPMGREPGEPLWPNFYTIDHLLDLKANLPSSSWNALYCGRPTNAEGDVMKAEWFRRYSDLPQNTTDSVGKVSNIVRRITVSVDTASKTNERNDYTVATVWVETYDGNHYLAEVVRKRVEYQEMEELIEDTARRWKADAILVEDKGSGIQYIQNRRGRAPAPVIPIKVTLDSKQFRFDGVTPMFEAGNVFIPVGGLWVPDYERELLDFPNGSFDDQVDSTSQYLNWVKSRRTGGTKKLSGVSYGQQGAPEDLKAKIARTLAQLGPSGRIGG